MRVVLDSNVLISAFATRGLCAELFRDVAASHELLVSDYILAEVTEKLRARLGIPEPTVRGIEELLRGFVTATEADPRFNVNLRDPDDVPVVAFAVAVAADILVTGDRDMLDVAGSLPVKVIPPREFFARQR